MQKEPSEESPPKGECGDKESQKPLTFSNPFLRAEMSGESWIGGHPGAWRYIRQLAGTP